MISDRTNCRTEP